VSVRSGELALRRLPAVLLDLHDDRATGRLLLRRGRISKSIDLANGDPISATSSAREETLGHFLASTGVITAQVHRDAVARATRDRTRIGEALVALGAVTTEKLAVHLTDQARHKLVQALRWPQGAWRFDPATTPGPADGEIRLAMIDVVLSGLRETPPDVDAMRALDGQEVELTDRGKALLDDLYRVFGRRALDAIVLHGKIAEIERAVGDAGKARAVVDSLLLCGAVITRATAIGLGAGAPTTMPASPEPPMPPMPPPRSPASPSDGLYDLLFGELGSPTELEGTAPIAVVQDEDSGVFAVKEVQEVARSADQTTHAHKELLGEHLRIQGVDHYAVLMVDARASAAAIATALAERASKFSYDFYARFDLGKDRAKLDEIHAAYGKARATLLDDARRRAYDRELAGGELVAPPPAMATEHAFRALEDQMAKGQWKAAVVGLEPLVSANAGEADYQVAYGWSLWNAAGMSAAAADLARPHLNQALAINPDHAAAHDYTGRISLALENDEHEAIFHLERAVELDPSRLVALDLLERTLQERGDIRRLERLLRRVLYQLSGASPTTQVALWVRLGRLQLHHLDDPRAARVSLHAAQRLGASHPDVVVLAGELDKTPNLDADALRAARDRWSRGRDTEAGSALVQAAMRVGQPDAAYLVASAMVATGTADPASTDLYFQQRPKTVRRTTGMLDAESWGLLRHPDDTLDLGALIELLAPAIHRVAPLELAELDIEPGTLVDDKDLPQAFARLRSYFASILGVPPAPVYAKPDLGMTIHVGAIETPVLLAGDEALTAPERPELAFRLARAMTFLWPGRALGASRPARVLKAVVAAMFREASNADIPIHDEKLAAAAKDALGVLSFDLRGQARGAVMRLVARQPELNLSKWGRALVRTADRAGLLLSGDLPVAMTAARELGGGDELVEFGTSRDHQQLRAKLGLGV
jgi:tetratricopeptide (TPR) repeat protein